MFAGGWPLILHRSFCITWPPAGFKNNNEMKEFWKILEKDIHSEQFTRRECIIYGIVAPLAFVAVVIVAGMIE